MENQIQNKFPASCSNNCLWKTNELSIYLKDQEDGKCIQTNSTRFDFVIENPKGKEIKFLSIDQCTFNHQSQHKKCDFATFDDKTFIFVEIKDTYNRSSTHKKKAKQQLKATIIKFKSQINFTDFQLIAIISWRYRPIRPAVSTAMQIAKFEFLTDYNVQLLEGNKYIYT